MNQFIHQIEGLRASETIGNIDVEFCRFLRQLHPEVDDAVLMAALLTSVAYRSGDVCMNIHEQAGAMLFGESNGAHSFKTPAVDAWLTKLKASKLVGEQGAFKPLILDEAGRLYLQKFWQYEQNLVSQILKKAGQQVSTVDETLLKDGLDRLFTDREDDEPDWQCVAAVTAMHKKLTVISGGPGTGKTTTVARILALALEQSEAQSESLSIALAAPTGKAAARMEESIIAALILLDVSDEIKAAIPCEALTLHQLLGARRHTTHFKYNSDNPLPYDLVIIDEASMIDQVLMSRLMDALLEKTRLVLLGDKDQLASVEAGSVMGDICGDLQANVITPQMARICSKLSIDIPSALIKDGTHPLADSITLLTKSYRFKEKSGIALLAEAIKAGEAGRAIAVLDGSSFPGVSFSNITSMDDYKSLMADEMLNHVKSVRQLKTPAEKLEAYNRFRILAAHRTGPWGVDYINNLIEEALRKEGVISRYEPWYAGKPVIIHKNDYTLGLNNGDMGICMPDAEGNMKIFFATHETLLGIRPPRLPEHSTAFALTVHKAQGSEFKDVMLVLPDRLSKVLSRELVYTAVTRARNSVKIIGDSGVLAEAIEHKITRNSGLEHYLWR